MSDGLLLGIWHSLSPLNLLFGFIGCMLGTIVGVLPGLGPTSAIAILFPITLKLEPTAAIIMLGGIFYGSQYGGSTTSILMNVPGEASSVATCFDGYKMAQQGRAGQALAISAIGSFIGGTIGIIGLTIAAPKLGEVGFYFGPPDYSALFIFSLLSMALLSSSSVLKGILMTLLGMTLSTVGITLGGVPCFTYGSAKLLKGIDLISLIVGLFGISEILIGLQEEVVTIAKSKLGKLMPSLKEFSDCTGAIFRATGLGFFMGLLPGMSGAVITFLSYNLERRISKNRMNFGKGAIEGVCSPETANNAACQAAYIPLMVFGIPASPSLAILLAALTIHGLPPGPTLFLKHTEFFWTIVGAMYVGNVILLILNLPLVGVWARIAYIPYKLLAPIMLGLSLIGTFAIRNDLMDCMIAIIFGVFGYAAKNLNWPTAPLIMGFILGPMLEAALRSTLSISGGSMLILLSRPISLIFVILTIVVVFLKMFFQKAEPKEAD